MTDPKLEEAVETLNTHLEKADEIRAHYYGKPDGDRDVSGPIEVVLQALAEAQREARVLERLDARIREHDRGCPCGCCVAEDWLAEARSEESKS